MYVQNERLVRFYHSWYDTRIVGPSFIFNFLIFEIVPSFIFDSFCLQMKKISAENNSNSAEIDINDDLDREITPSEKPRHEEKSVDGGLKTGHQNRVTKGQLATKCIRHYPALKSPLPPHLGISL